MKKPTLEEQNKFIRDECNKFADFLVAKNTAYGGQAFAPIGILGKGDPLDGIFIRIDDKMNRIINGQAAGEDPWQDLRGYITLWQVVKALKAAGYYSDAPVTDSPPANASMLPMPIDQVFSTSEMDLAEVPNTGLVIGESEDPTELPVQDIKAIVDQKIVSLEPNIPAAFEEVEKEAGVPVTKDPWEAMHRLPRRK